MELKDYQLQVLVLIAEGYSTEEISLKLFISKRTVEGIRQRLIKELDARNTPSLIYNAFKRGLIV